VPKAAPHLYVVQRLNWRRHAHGLVRLPGRTRLQSFPDPGAAQADCRRREQEARARVNPFTCGGPALHHQTRFDEGRLCDWLLDAGVEPPDPAPGTGRAWAAWWDQAHAKWSDLQRDKVWEALDRVRFFEVVQRPARPLGYVVVWINWAYNDEYFVAEHEGGAVNVAFRNRKKAQSYADEATFIARQAYSNNGVEDDFDMTARLHCQGDPLTPPARGDFEKLRPLADVPFYEVVEVELEE
jgi:hypothetical protein